jgi:anthranilate phosphoribosyltransferase
MSQENFLKDLVSLKDLTPEQITYLFEGILEGRIPQSQVAAVLALMSAKGESGEEIAIAAQTVMKRSLPIEYPTYLFGDIVGTGGDGFNTINVSTLASLVAAAAGFPVAKHGSISVSSQCGSADILRALDIDIMRGPKEARQSLDRNSWCFLFAPNYHPSFKAVKDLRRELGIKTIFNILGPLVNPLLPPLMVIGVYDPKFLMPFAVALKGLGRKKALIVHGSGLDEITVHGTTQAILLEGESIERLTLSPSDLGLKTFALADLAGGTVEQNIGLSIDLLSGRGHDAKNSIVAASAGALLWLAGEASSLKKGVDMAMGIIKSGDAMKLVEKLREQGSGT